MNFIKIIGVKNYDSVLNQIDNELKTTTALYKRFRLFEIRSQIENKKIIDSFLKN